jgi:hypothetical protein
MENFVAQFLATIRSIDQRHARSKTSISAEPMPLDKPTVTDFQLR